jgi:hypothetical protein
MGDPAVAVAPFAGEVQLLGVVAVAGERDPLGDQPFHRLPAALDHEAHRVVVAEARPGDVGVADVVCKGVGLVQDRGDPALGPAGGPVEELVLGHQGHLAAASARCRAADMPARPLPMIRTSYAKWSRFPGRPKG